MIRLARGRPASRRIAITAAMLAPRSTLLAVAVAAMSDDAFYNEFRSWLARRRVDHNRHPLPDEMQFISEEELKSRVDGESARQVVGWRGNQRGIFASELSTLMATGWRPLPPRPCPARPQPAAGRTLSITDIPDEPDAPPRPLSDVKKERNVAPNAPIAVHTSNSTDQEIRTALREAIEKRAAEGGKRLNGKEQVQAAMAILRSRQVTARSLKQRVEQIADKEFRKFRGSIGVRIS